MKTRHLINPGDRFNSLTAVAPATRTIQGLERWLFLCDCGRYRARVVSAVVNGYITKCICCSAKENAARRPREIERDNAILAALSRGERAPSIALRMGLTKNIVYGVKYRLSPERSAA